VGEGAEESRLDGDMDQLRARAFLDTMLGRDSRDFLSSGPADPATGAGTDRAGGAGAGGAGVPPTAGVLPAGFAGRINLTIPLATQLDLAERPGELAGIGPIDPDPEANTSDRYRTLTGFRRTLTEGTAFVTVSYQHLPLVVVSAACCWQSRLFQTPRRHSTTGTAPDAVAAQASLPADHLLD
jgi:hypothetical protein